MREIRLALLEADVNFQVVKDFVAQVRERATGQEVLKSLTRRAAGREDRARGADLADGLRRLAARVRAPADRDPARRPAGLRQDDHVRQARAAAAQGRQEARARRRRPAAPRRDRPARAARPPDPDPGLPQGHEGSGRGRQVRDPGGADRRPGRRHPRHRRPPAHRRGADGRARARARRRQADERAARARRDDRPGGRQRRAVLPGARRLRRRHPDEARRRRARRRRALGAGRSPASRSSSSRSARSSTSSRSSIPTGWPRGSSAWATS